MTGPGGITRLEPKVMLVLVCLAEHAGQMVPKDRLLHSAWPDTAVGDDVLTRAISELRRLFEDDPKQPRVIETIPKSGYRLIAPVEMPSGEREVVPTTLPTSETHGADLLPAQESRRAEARAVACDAGRRRSRRHCRCWRSPAPGCFEPLERLPAPAMRVVPLTAMSGSEYGGAFSPDGRQVAFAWNGEIGRRHATVVAGQLGHLRQACRVLRRAPAHDGSRHRPAPAMVAGRSPDRVRARWTGPYRTWQIRVMSSLGGSDRQVSDFPDLAAGRRGLRTVATWWQGERAPPDAAHPTNGIYLIPVQGGEPRAITRPRAPGAGPVTRVFTGRPSPRVRLVSGRVARLDCHVQVVDLDSAFAAVGSPRRLTGPTLRWAEAVVTWSRDGQFVIFNAEEVQLNYLWRVEVDGEQPPERIEMAGVNAFFPSISPTGDRLAFTRSPHDEDIYRFEPGRPAQPVARSSVLRRDAAVLAGRPANRLLLAAIRRRDGGLGRQRGRVITGAADAWPGSISVSAVVVTRRPADRVRVGEASTLISGPSTARAGHRGRSPTMPATRWLRPGRATASGSTSRGRRRMTATSGVRGSRNGSKERVTRGGGFIASESVDGSDAVVHLQGGGFAAHGAAAGRRRTPRQVIACVAGTAFAVNPLGIYYMPCSGSPAEPILNPPVHVMDPATGEDRDSRQAGEVRVRQPSVRLRGVAGWPEPFCTAGSSGTNPTSC